jgi:hypothetical protein
MQWITVLLVMTTSAERSDGVLLPRDCAHSVHIRDCSAAQGNGQLRILQTVQNPNMLQFPTCNTDALAAAGVSHHLQYSRSLQSLCHTNRLCFFCVFQE